MSSSTDPTDRLNTIEARLGRIEVALGLERPVESMTWIKALIKNGSNAYFNGVRENPHAAGSREHELWQYGTDLARDISRDGAKNT